MSEAARALALRRWSKTTAQQRKAWGRKLNMAKARKRAARARKRRQPTISEEALRSVMPPADVEFDALATAQIGRDLHGLLRKP